MTSFIALILIELAFVTLNLYLFSNDILTPATVSSIVFIIATILAMYCIDYWKIRLSALTVMVIAVGLAAMTLGEYAGRRIVIGSHKQIGVNNKNTEKTLTPISINRTTRNIFLFGILILTIAYGIDAYGTGMANGGSKFNAFAYMKRGYIYGGATMNPIVRQGFKVVMAGAYVSSFIFACNLMVLRQAIKKNWQYLIIIICGLLITIFSGSRTEILRIVSALLLDYALLWRKNRGGTVVQNKKSTKQIIKKMLPLVLIVSAIAFAARTVVKTADVSLSQGSTSFLYYLAYYVGSPIAVLNTKINAAFTGIDILRGSKVSIPEFVYLGDLDYGGNVGTILQTKVISDGITAMFLWVFLIYCIGGSLYKHILNGFMSNRKKYLFCVAFSSWYYIFTMSYYADIMSSMNFIITNVLTSIVIIIIYKCVISVRIRL